MITRRRFLLGACGSIAAVGLVPRIAWSRDGPSAPEPVHVGTYDVVLDRSLNFQINRWVALGGERVLREIQAMAPRLVSLDAWRNEFLTSAERALAAGRTHDAAILLRSAEFFMTSADPRKRPSRERFLALMRQAYGGGPPERVPFAGGDLPFLRFVSTGPRAPGVMFGGAADCYADVLALLT